MLFDSSDVLEKRKKKSIEYFPFDKLFPTHIHFVGQPWEILSKHIGKIEQGAIINFWTFGRFNMADVINYLLRQVGACKVNACTWAISIDAVNTILNRKKDGLISDFKLWIDPRVKVRNPEPLQMCKANFPVIIKPVHAKVCTLSNDNWKISVSGSLNFTSNPQPERGVIQCIDSVFEYDNKIIENEF
jgi:hypothetical protein